jgi:hypothetical protein
VDECKPLMLGVIRGAWTEDDQIFALKTKESCAVPMAGTTTLCLPCHMPATSSTCHVICMPRHMPATSSVRHVICLQRHMHATSSASLEPHVTGVSII